MGADGISGPSGGGLPQKGIQPGAAASGGIRIGEISGLKPGDLFEAKILGALSDTEALLDIGGGAVTAKTPFSFSGMEGEGVLLKVLGRAATGELLLKLGDQSPDQSPAGQSGVGGAIAELQQSIESGAPAAAALDRLEGLLAAQAAPELPAAQQSALLNVLIGFITSDAASNAALNGLISLMNQEAQGETAPAANQETAASPTAAASLPDISLPEMAGLTGPALEKAFLASGILFESKLLALAGGRASEKAPGIMDKDLKALLIKFHQTIAGGAARAQDRQAAGLAGRLLNDIRAFQFLSRLTGSLYSFLPVKWEGLRDGQAAFKTGQAGASCVINLDLGELGRINVSVFMRDGGFYITLRVENRPFRDALRKEAASVKNSFREKGLVLKMVNVADYEESSRNHLEFPGAAERLVNIRL